MANNRYDKVHLNDAQLTNLATGGTIINGSDTYTADDTALYLIDEQLDTTPTQNSTNAITSGGVYSALADKQNLITSTNKLSADLIEDGSTNKVFTSAEQTKLSGIENGAEANDVTDFQVNGTSVVNNKVGNIVTNTAYDATNNKLATMNDLSGFITNTVDNLTNYYTKSETYTQTEINSLIGGITTITYEIVNSLPTATADTYFNTSKKVYLVAITGGSGTDYYDEYVTVRSGTENNYTYSWEKIGNTQVDLSNYVDKTTAQTISGVKTFSSGPLLNNNLFLQGKNTSSSAINLIGISGTNNVLINNNSSGNTLVGGSIFAPVSAQSQVASLGGTNNLWKNLFLSGFIGSANNASYGLKLPSTSGWTANKTIATTDQIPSVPVTDIQINGASILSSGIANILTNTAYNSSSNKIATMSDLPDTSTFYTKSGGALNAGATITMTGSNPYVGLQETGGTQYYLQGYQGEVGISVGGSWPTKRISLDSNGKVFIPSKSIGDGTYTYTLPNKTGTVAMTSDIPNIPTTTGGGLVLKSTTTAGVVSWQNMYPVGGIYMSTSSTSPASLFGGTWEQLKDKFLLAAGDTYSAGATGGEANHTLTTIEMPTHSHSERFPDYVGNVNNSYTLETGGNKEGSYVGSGWYNQRNGNVLLTGDAGYGAAHNNMPPYLVVYMWKRTG